MMALHLLLQQILLLDRADYRQLLGLLFGGDN